MFCSPSLRFGLSTLSFSLRFTKTRSDFPTLGEYNDYLEMVETYGVGCSSMVLPQFLPSSSFLGD